MKFPWFKMPSGFRNDPKLKRMPIHQRYAFIVLLCLASESEERGTILGLDDEDLAFELEMALEDWLTLKAKFRVKALIDFDSTTVTICDWDCMQYDKPSDRAEETRRRKQEQRARDAANKAIQEALTNQDVTPVTPLSRDVTLASRDVTLASHDVTQNVTQIRGDETTEDQIRGKENTRSEDTYVPPVENFSEPCQPVQQTLIVDMAEEKKETPPPTPAPLSPENVGLAIASPKTVKPRKVKDTDIDSLRLRYQTFLEVFNQDAPERWQRYTKLTAKQVEGIDRFAKKFGDRAIEIFQKGLMFAKTSKFHNGTVDWDIAQYLTNNKPLDLAEKYEASVSQQSPADSPMTPKRQKMAADYNTILEAIHVRS